jgi:hypothetical protein
MSVLDLCAIETPSSIGCDFKNGQCLSGFAAFIGRLITNRDFSRALKEPTHQQRERITANAEFMERQATILRQVISWIESGNNGNSSRNAADKLGTAIRQAARAKPDGGGTCNGNICILKTSQMIETLLSAHVILQQAIGALELKRIANAAHQLEENADNLRAVLA